MNYSNLMMPKTQISSDSRGGFVNNNKIRVRVPPAPGSRKVQILPSSSAALVSSSASKTASSCNHHAEFLLQNYANFKKSGEPARFMFYQNGSWVDLERRVFEVLKLGFVEGKPVVEAEVGGQNCLFDFHRMLQIEFDSLSQRSIAWIDVSGKCFFPKVFVNTGEDSEDFEDFEDVNVVKENLGYEGPKIEVEITIREKGENSKSFEDSEGNEVNLSKRKRGNEENEEVSSSNFAVKRRQIMESEVKKPMWPKTKVLMEEEQGYVIMKNLFLAGLAMIDPGARITAIHQCTRNGPMDKARLEIFQKQMELTKRARGDANMVFAWYGTSAKGVETILAHGFGMPSKLRASESYGVGVYLSPVRSPQNSAMLSEVDDNGEKHVVLCRVILGKCERIEVGSQQSYPSSMDYDTGVDDLNNPNWYVVWSANMNTHIIPECVVSYKLGYSVAGQVNGTTSVKWVPRANTLAAKLFSKLSTCLPPSKVRHLQTLCNSYKDGKLEKDIFMKQLRSVVGDEMLRATIHEIRG